LQKIYKYVDENYGFMGETMSQEIRKEKFVEFAAPQRQKKVHHPQQTCERQVLQFTGE
jgi:hypothetical protein